MNTFNRQNNTNSNVPENLPHIEVGNGNGYRNKNDNGESVELKISKKKLKNISKIVIIVIIVLISLPRMVNNVNSTLSIIQGQAEKFPTVFPSLTATGTGIGNFAFDGIKSFTGFVADNLASMAELLYSRRVQPGDITIDSDQATEIKALPVKIVIDKIGVDSVVLNPESTDVNDLDESLKYGVVRYPKSGLLGENDNVYLFGHSTGIAQVRNQAYKALNGIETLQQGDVIKVQSSQREYLYKVTSVVMQRNSNAIVQFNTGKKMLTLSTCNTLGEKEDRHIVTADFVVSYPLDTEGIENNNNGENNNNNGGSGTITPNPGTETSEVIQIPGGGYYSDPYGKPDLKAEITEVGIIDPLTKDFFATSTYTIADKIAVKFTISNIGTKTAEGWSFNVALPTNPFYIYHGKSQQNLKPGEKIEYALAFDKPTETENGRITVNADPTQGLIEPNETNNIVHKIIKITKND